MQNSGCSSTIALSSHPVPPRSTPNQHPDNTIGARQIRVELPCDALIEVFGWLRQEVGLRPLTQLEPSSEQPARGGTTARDVAGPQLSITAVCKAWRDVALDTPLLWATVPILIEDFGSLCLGNPGQVAYHLQRARNTHALKLIIGNRHQLTGPGVKSEYPMVPTPFILLQTLAPRVTELTVAVDNRSGPIFQRLESQIFNPQHSYDILRSVWLQGSIGHGTSPVIGRAGFWKSPRLRSVTWITSTIGRPPSLSASPWIDINLTELVLRENFQVMLDATVVRQYLSVARSLVRLEVQVCDRYSRPYLSLSPRIIHHECLQILHLSIHGFMSRDKPTFLRGLVLPNLRSFIFGVDRLVCFDYSDVVHWLGSGSHSRLKYLELSKDFNDVAALIRLLANAPVLEVLKCVRLTDHDLRAISPVSAFDAALVHRSIRAPLHARDIPCPSLQELYVAVGWFSSDAVEAFIKARLYGGDVTRASSEPGFSAPLTPLRLVSIGGLLEVESVYGTRELVRQLKGEHGVVLIVASGIYPAHYSGRWSV